MTSFKIDYFEIPVPDAKRSSAFFSRAFGFGALSYGDDYIEIRDAGVLGGVNADAVDRATAPLIGIRTDDIAAAATAIVMAGGTITKPVYAYPGGKRLLPRARRSRTPGLSAQPVAARRDGPNETASHLRGRLEQQHPGRPGRHAGQTHRRL